MRVGMEATGYSRWFERLLTELGFELWIGDPERSSALKKDLTEPTLLEMFGSQNLYFNPSCIVLGNVP